MSLLIRRAFTSLSKSLITKEHFSPQVMIVHAFHNNQILYNRRKKASSDISLNYFDASKSKEKDVFLEIIRIYLKENTLLRGHTQFILRALKYMNEFGVNKDLETYKALLRCISKR